MVGWYIDTISWCGLFTFQRVVREIEKSFVSWYVMNESKLCDRHIMLCFFFNGRKEFQTVEILTTSQADSLTWREEELQGMQATHFFFRCQDFYSPTITILDQAKWSPPSWNNGSLLYNIYSYPTGIDKATDKAKYRNV